MDQAINQVGSIIQQNLCHAETVELWSAHSKTHCHLILYCNAIVVPDF